MPAVIANFAQFPTPFGWPENGFWFASVLSTQQQNQTTISNKHRKMNTILLVIVGQTDHVLLDMLVVQMIGRYRVLHPERDRQILT